MTVSILFITHSGIGLALMTTLTNTFGENIMPMSELSIGKEPDPDALAATALNMVEQLDQGDGVLVFTDMIGSTPCNIAQKLAQSDHELSVITGVNLPMMFRVFNYPKLSLDVLTKKALNAGREGILEPIKDSKVIVAPKSRKRAAKTTLTESLKLYDKKASSDH